MKAIRYAAFPICGLLLRCVLVADEPAIVWWQSSGLKVLRQDPPQNLGQPLRLAAARNEHEPFQIVVTPKSPELKEATITVSDLTGPAGAKESDTHRS